MRLIRRVEISDDSGHLDSTNVSADSTTEWTTSAVSEGDQRKVTTTSNGAATATWKIYEALQAHSNQDPTTDVGTVSQFVGTYWKEVSAVNEYKMFDIVPQDQTVNADTIEVTIDIDDQYVTGIAFFNLNATDINITITDDTEGEVYNEDFDLTLGAGVNNWYDWFFEPITRLNNFVVMDLPPYLGATIDITITATGENAACGNCVLGQALKIGDTQFGAGFSMTDYSDISYDPDTQRVTFEEGDYTEDGQFEIQLDNEKFSSTKQQLVGLRNTPVAWVPDENRIGTLLFGYFREFELVLSGPTRSRCILEIAGLT